MRIPNVKANRRQNGLCAEDLSLLVAILKNYLLKVNLINSSALLQCKHVTHLDMFYISRDAICEFGSEDGGHSRETMTC